MVFNFYHFCRSGYHASRDPLDALVYSPGTLLYRVPYEDTARDKQKNRFNEPVEESF